MTPHCGACLHWKRRYDDAHGRGRGTCWDAVPCVMTHEDDACDAFQDRLANRAEFEAMADMLRRTTPRMEP
jgi:hypothetical protein